MSHITIESLTSHITEQEELAVMRELNNEEIVTVVGGSRGANTSAPGSENDTDGGNNVNVTVNVLPILSQNNLVLGLLSNLSSGLLSVLGPSLA